MGVMSTNLIPISQLGDARGKELNQWRREDSIAEAASISGA